MKRQSHSVAAGGVQLSSSAHRPHFLLWLFALPLRFFIFLYQKLISPVLPAACRYYPSCSHYAAEALALHGAGQGSLFAARRLLRCHPWAPGGIDPVPRR